jgi:hypothetical protein
VKWRLISLAPDIDIPTVLKQEFRNPGVFAT